MAGQRFNVRIAIPTLAIIDIAGQPTAIYVEVGDVVTVEDGSLNDPRLVDVEWDGRRAMMFVVDLMQRAERIQDAASAMA